MEKLTPRQIVKELDKYIIGQDKAKKAVSIALRNRWRRLQVSEDLRDEILPNNIILIGPTGVGKTEISRRLSKLANAPFVKVEASKFTEVGYVGRDVESMIRELMDLAVSNVKAQRLEDVEEKAIKNAEDKILSILLPPIKKSSFSLKSASGIQEYKKALEKQNHTRGKLRKMLKAGVLDERVIEIDTNDLITSRVEVFSNFGLENFDINIGEVFGGMIPFQEKKKKQKMSIKQALDYLTVSESHKLVDMEEVKRDAKYLVENNGIIFLDEIDKIAGNKSGAGPDVSREGVQRDLLPIIEGSNVPTKYGMVNTTHILFIASGAFHSSKPSDLIPELQGRFPIRVELNSLTRDDFVKILTLPRNALIKQYQALLSTEKVELHFTKSAIEKIADYAALANEKMEDIGARRLHTVMTTLLERYLFNLPDGRVKKVRISEKTVVDILDSIIKDEDLTRYIL
ncbi:MAG: HslU--HslV peptidase ATPase subunit [Candidatus Cloacimonadota bacterium]|nr:MAG: HslU--HslV peptidase ATPase subunit [Candidatus Cloacimonadota bacterium]